MTNLDFIFGKVSNTMTKCKFEFRPWRGVGDTTQFVSDLRQVGGFLRFHPPIKLTATIIEILLKVALNTVTP